jgi:sec-independent protein translocase protein TatA
VIGLENPIHILFLLAILLLLFGAKRLPEMGRSLGSGIRGFRETISGQAPVELTAPAGDPAAAVEEPAATTQGR